MEYVGIIIFALTLAFVLVVSRSILTEIDVRIYRPQIYSILYLSFALALYFSFRIWIRFIIQGNDWFSFPKSLQFLFFVLSVGLIMQSLFLISIKSSKAFYRLLFPSITCLLMCMGAMWFVGFGIINITWSIVFTGTTAGYLLCTLFTEDIKQKVAITIKLKEPKEKRDALDVLRKEIDLYLKLAVQAFFSLGASIGVSMTILFKDGETAWNKLELQVSAAAMVSGLALVSFGLLFVFAKPYIETIINISKAFAETLELASSSDVARKSLSNTLEPAQAANTQNNNTGI